MSKIECNIVDSISGTNTLTLGSSNASTIALGSGDVQSNFMYPMFSARMQTGQVISNNTHTLLVYSNELIDTNSAYDSTASNYKFTVPSGMGGKYFLYAQALPDAASDANLFKCRIQLYKNGSVIRLQQTNFSNNYILNTSIQVTSIEELSAGDYIQVYIRGTDSSGSITVDGTNADLSLFCGYRIGT